MSFMTPTSTRRDPDARGYFGEFGGRFVPETLVEPIEALERAYFEVRDDARFRSELDRLLKHYVGRPTPVTECERLSYRFGVRVLLKREDLAHTGSHTLKDPESDPDDFFSLHSGGINFLMGDGSVRFLKSTVDIAVLHALSTRAGGEPLSATDY